MSLGGPLSDFTRLTNLISISTPADTSVRPINSVSADDPSLIILCSWVGAAPKHIAKYAAVHREWYPQTTILLIQSTVSGMIAEVDLDPALQVLISTRTNDSTQTSTKRIAFHAFSNGGARTAARLTTAFHAFRSKNSHLSISRSPFDTIIFDCCPGTAGLLSTARAISYSLPITNYILRSLVFATVYMLGIFFMAIALVCGWEDSISNLRRVLNDPDDVPVDVPRLYVFSEQDQLVDAGDVRAHAAHARQRGYSNVKEVVFANAMHCALVNEDGERYWEAVRAVME